MVVDVQAVRDFAIKWNKKFKNQDSNLFELVERYMGDECAALGFEMD